MALFARLDSQFPQTPVISFLAYLPVRKMRMFFLSHKDNTFHQCYGMVDSHSDVLSLRLYSLLTTANWECKSALLADAEYIISYL